MTINYFQPDLINSLILISFFYFLQFNNLLVQIAIGILYSSTKLISIQFQEILINLGYLGLILLIFQAGLDFNPNLFESTLLLSIIISLVGILLPISFTFALFSSQFYSINLLNSFLIGSALASTSLGTTIKILSSTLNGKLLKTKLGSILIFATLLDDIISLILLSIIQSIKSNDSSNNNNLTWTIIKPILSSILMILITPLIIYWILKPLIIKLKLEKRLETLSDSILFTLIILVLSAYLTIAYYTTTTPLLASYLSALFLTLPSLSLSTPIKSFYNRKLNPIQLHILEPIFFASIGFSIPFLGLFTSGGNLVIKGLLYSILMSLGKLLPGFGLFIYDLLFPSLPSPSPSPSPLPSSQPSIPSSSTFKSSLFSSSLLPSLILGTALIPRGEISLLILQLAFPSSSSSSTSNSDSNKDAYLIGIWAVLICTLFGPIFVWYLVKGERGEKVLRGRWGV